MNPASNPELLEGKKLYDFGGAAEQLGCSPWTLRAHAARGTLAVVRIGRLVRIPSDEIARIQREGLPSLRDSQAEEAEA